MALRLEYRGETSLPVEVEGLTPDVVCGLSLAEIEQFEIFHGNRKLPLAEMFRVSGDPADMRFDFEGDLSGVHWLGAHMRAGDIWIHGNAGRHLGSELAGGSIIVEGNAGDWVGGEMHGGRIHVAGDAGHLVGAAYRGSSRGMTGGTLLVDGNVGDEIGHSMRRGVIAVGGRAGDMAAFNMIAGSLFLFGGCGIRPGAGMRRGTIGLLGGDIPRLLPSFRYSCRFRPPAFAPLFRKLRTHRFAMDAAFDHAEFDLYHGDFVAMGRGEIFTPTTT